GWLLPILAATGVGVPEAAGMLRGIYNTLPADDISKLEIAALLLKLQPKNKELVTFLLQQQNLPDDKLPFPTWRYYVVEAMGMSKHPQFVSRLESCVKDYLNKGDLTIYRDDGVPDRSELAVAS